MESSSRAIRWTRLAGAKKARGALLLELRHAKGRRAAQLRKDYPAVDTNLGVIRRGIFSGFRRRWGSGRGHACGSGSRFFLRHAIPLECAPQAFIERN